MVSNSSNMVLESDEKIAFDLMKKGRHVEAAEHLAAMVDACEAGNLKTKAGAKLTKDSPEFKAFIEGDLYKTETGMKERFDIFYDFLEQMEKWEQLESKKLVENDIKIFHNFSKDGKMNLMVDFKIPYSMKEVAALFYEQDLYHEWLKVPTGDPLKVTANVCPTLLSLQAQVPIKWPVWDRWANVRAMTYFDRSCQGILQIIWSHDEGVNKFFGKELPGQPDNTVRIHMHKIYRYFEKVDDHTTRYLQMNDAEIGMDMMPQGVKDFMMKTKIVNDVPNFKANFEKIHPLYKKRVEEKAALYEDLHKLIDDADEDDE